MTVYSKFFDGEDFIYTFENNVIVYYEDVERVDNLYGENLGLFTCGYMPQLGDTIVDIGAGNGFEIQSFSNLVGPYGRVIAIEADPKCYRRLEKLVRLAKLENVVCINVAVSNEIKQYFLTQTHPGGVSNYLSSESIAGSIPVQTTITSKIFENYNIEKVSLLKMNIEGHEGNALLGMVDYLDRCENLTIACHDFMNIPNFKTKSRVQKILSEYGFVIATFNNAKHDWEKDYVFAQKKGLETSTFSNHLNAQYSKNATIMDLKEAKLKLESEMLRLRGEFSSSIIAREARNISKAFLRRLIYCKNYIVLLTKKCLNFLNKIFRGKFYKFNRFNETFFVGTTKASGLIQLKLLISLGLKPEHKLIEFGCGALNGSLPIFTFLQRGNYVGVDPNSWLRTVRTIKSFKTFRKRLEKKPKFLSNADFQGPRDQNDFDFVFSHSVLSHASRSQVSNFFKNSSSLLKNGGIIVSSWRDTQGNNFGSLGSPNNEESDDVSWVYPGVTFYSKNTLIYLAAENGLQIEFAPYLTEMLTRSRQGEYHDWFVARKKII